MMLQDRHQGLRWNVGFQNVTVSSYEPDGGDARNTIGEGGDIVFAPGADIDLRPGQFFLLQEIPGILDSEVQVEPDHAQAAAFPVLLPEGFEQGDFGAARRAPARPEHQQHGGAPFVAEFPGFVIGQRLALNLRGGLARLGQGNRFKKQFAQVYGSGLIGRDGEGAFHFGEGRAPTAGVLRGQGMLGGLEVIVAGRQAVQRECTVFLDQGHIVVVFFLRRSATRTGIDEEPPVGIPGFLIFLIWVERAGRLSFPMTVPVRPAKKSTAIVLPGSGVMSTTWDLT